MKKEFDVNWFRIMQANTQDMAKIKKLLEENKFKVHVNGLYMTIKGEK